MSFADNLIWKGLLKNAFSYVYVYYSKAKSIWFGILGTHDTIKTFWLVATPLYFASVHLLWNCYARNSEKVSHSYAMHQYSLNKSCKFCYIAKAKQSRQIFLLFLAGNPRELTALLYSSKLQGISGQVRIGSEEALRSFTFNTFLVSANN